MALHPLHHVWRLLPQGPRRAALLHGARLLAPRPDRVPPPARAGLAVAGEIDRPSGLGEAARLLLDGAAALQVAGFPAQGATRPPEGAPLVLVGNPLSLPRDLLRLGRYRIAGRRVIGYWLWELPTIPASWRHGAELVHEVWTSSRFTAAALAPIAPSARVVTLPAALRPPAPSGKTRADFDLPTEAVVTLVRFNLASSFERKNPLGAVEAHLAAFGDRSDRVLLLHVLNPDHFPADFARLRAACGPNVRIVTEALARADADAMLACADIVLSLHRSEGFGLVPAEGMLMGKPVVATDWSGNTDFMDATCAAMVPARLVEVRDPRGVYAGAVWAEPDVGVAADWLRRLADDPALRARLGAAARHAAAERLGPASLRDALAGLGLLG